MSTYYYCNNELEHSFMSSMKNKINRTVKNAVTTIKKNGINIRRAGKKAVTTNNKKRLTWENQHGYLDSSDAKTTSKAEKDSRHVSSKVNSSSYVGTKLNKSAYDYTAAYKNAKRHTHDAAVAQAQAFARSSSSAQQIVVHYRAMHPNSKLSDAQILRNAGYGVSNA